MQMAVNRDRAAIAAPLGRLQRNGRIRHFATALGGLYLLAAAPAHAECDTARDVALVNGRIFTMAQPGAAPAETSAIVIRNGRVVHLGPGGRRYHTACTKVFDLKGRTAVPGLIDGHIHALMWGRRPGHDVRLDLATSVGAAVSLLAERSRDVPPGEWLTAAGGWYTGQFAEKRLPNRAELDAAASRNPVLLISRDSRGVTNSLGQAFFVARGVKVEADGTLAPEDTAAAFFHLTKQFDTLDGQKQRMQRVMADMAELGLTTVSDMGVADGATDPRMGWPLGADVGPAFEPIHSLWREGKLTVRFRLNLMEDGLKPPQLAERLRLVFPHFGDDMLKTVCMGERLEARGSGPPPFPGYEAGAFAVAKAGWCHEQHTLPIDEVRRIVEIWTRVNKETPIAPLRWRLGHVVNVDAAILDQLKALGAGLNVGAQGWVNPQYGWTPYRTLVASGLPVGGSSDGPNYNPVNPWIHLSMMVTGRDANGTLVGVNETISREEALKTYTVNNAWFLFEDKNLGALDPGRLGDVIVLDRNYFSIPDAEIKDVRSVLTIVGGAVVHDAMSARSGTAR